MAASELPPPKHPHLPLKPGMGWKTVPPRATDWTLFWISGQKLLRSTSDFTSIENLGDMGPVESPFAIDPEGGRIFRYRSSNPLGADDRNDIVAFTGGRGSPGKVAFKLHPNRWVPWMLHYLPGAKSLLGLVSLGLPPAKGAGVRIEHRLGYFNLSNQREHLFSLPPDCFTPLAFNRRSNEVLFHGVTGFQCVDRAGRLQWKQGPHGIDRPWGASTDTLSGGWLVGGAPLIHLPGKGSSCAIVAKEGLFPVWHPNGKSLFLARSSGDLFLFHPASGEWEPVCSIAGNRHPEMKRGRPVSLSPDGRYFALPLTRRAPLGEASGIRSWSEHQTLCIGDLQLRELWQHPGPVSEIAWLRRNPSPSQSDHH